MFGLSLLVFQLVKVVSLKALGCRVKLSTKFPCMLCPEVLAGKRSAKTADRLH